MRASTATSSAGRATPRCCAASSTRAAHVVGWSLCEQAPFRAARRGPPRRLRPDAPVRLGHAARRRPRGERARPTPPARGPVAPHRPPHRHARAERAVARRGRQLRAGQLRMSTAEIDAADVVVAGDGTYPALAIARGVPTVSMTATSAARSAFGAPRRDAGARRNPDRYLDYVRYPFDMSCGPVDEVLHAAARSEQPIARLEAPLHRRADGLRASRAVETIVAAGSRRPGRRHARLHVSRRSPTNSASGPNCSPATHAASRRRTTRRCWSGGRVCRRTHSSP